MDIKTLLRAGRLEIEYSTEEQLSSKAGTHNPIARAKLIIPSSVSTAGELKPDTMTLPLSSILNIAEAVRRGGAHIQRLAKAVPSVVEHGAAIRGGIEKIDPCGGRAG